MYHTKLSGCMKKIYIIANWKSNKTILQAGEWFQTLNNLLASRRSGQLTINKEKKEVIVCPPFTLLPFVRNSIVKGQLPVVAGAQDISPFDEGAYTGEVSSRQTKEFADYVIIGHSERRKHFNETNELIEQKIAQAIQFNLIPIICISEISQINDKWKMINGKFIIAYEPLFAIGSGNPDTPDNAENVAKKIKESINAPVLYGGSVASENVKNFTAMPNIDGVLVGGASLDVQEFYKIIQKA